MSVLSALAESGQLSSAVLASLPGTAVVVFDRELRCHLATGQALDRHGWNGEEMEARSIATVLPPDIAAEFEPHYRAALEGRAIHVDHASFDGTAVYRSEIAPLRQDGEIVGGIAVSRDVTEARAASAALGASEQRYRLLAEHATDVISRHAPDGTILYVSPSVRELLGVE